MINVYRVKKNKKTNVNGCLENYRPENKMGIYYRCDVERENVESKTVCNEKYT